MLDDVVAGAARAIFPTRRNLERLAGFASFGDAVANARAFPVRTVAPWTETRDGDPHLCIPDDLGYPVTARPAENTSELQSLMRNSSAVFCCHKKKYIES